MMNVTHEHLEFHGTWEQYRTDKANLFRNLDTHSHLKTFPGASAPLPSFGIVNADDPSASYFASCTEKPVYSFSLKTGNATLYATDLVPDEHGCSFILHEKEGDQYPARINLPGTFNVMNTMAALLAVSKATGRPCKDLIPLLPLLQPVRGRMMRISRGQPFEVIIDYAHTPLHLRQYWLRSERNIKEELSVYSVLRENGIPQKDRFKALSQKNTATF